MSHEHSSAEFHNEAGEQHDHHGHVHLNTSTGNSLLIAAAITFFIMLAEFVAGYITNSLALISDAGHMLVDVLSLVLSLVAYNYAKRPATEKNTFGFYRLEILTALLNGISLGVLSAFIIYEAWQRFFITPEIKSVPMIIVAIIGLAANVLSGFVLIKHSKKNINIKGAYLHIIGDALSSVGVIIAGIAIYFFNWSFADPVISVIIALMILKGSWSLIKESVSVLLESVPYGYDIKEIAEQIKVTSKAKEVHHIHIWTISSELHALSCHIKVPDMKITESEELVLEVQEMLKVKYNIKHVTIQFECQECAEPADKYKF